MSRLALLAILVGLSLVACNQSEGHAGQQLKPREADEGPLPRLNHVPDFSFKSQMGKPFGSEQLSGKPYLAAFMFTRCPSICPKLTARMKEIDNAVKKANKTLNLVSISVDPTNDTPEVLSEYARKHGANVSNWAFITGDYKAIARTSEEGFKVALSGQIDEGKPHLGITHGSHLILVDSKGDIRGYYRSSEDETVTRIVQALDRL